MVINISTTVDAIELKFSEIVENYKIEENPKLQVNMTLSFFVKQKKAFLALDTNIRRAFLLTLIFTLELKTYDFSYNFYVNIIVKL